MDGMFGYEICGENGYNMIVDLEQRRQRAELSSSVLGDSSLSSGDVPLLPSSLNSPSDNPPSSPLPPQHDDSDYNDIHDVPDGSFDLRAYCFENRIGFSC